MSIRGGERDKSIRSTRFPTMVGAGLKKGKWRGVNVRVQDGGGMHTAHAAAGCTGFLRSTDFRTVIPWNYVLVDASIDRRS